MNRIVMAAIAFALTIVMGVGCERVDRSGGDDEAGIDEAGADEDAQVDAELGTLRVANTVNEPIAVHLDGQALYTVPPGTSFTFRNLPTRRVTVYGVGQISQKHYGLPQLDIQAGEDYEWTIHP